ncbi:MAG TPA: AAA family ATPase [Solirubrobacteraceae bacterium]|nr:AAA family ATPase [Solirubrobacteraceae bacterium]
MTLLDREHEIAELQTALSEAREGRGRLVVVEASGGLGKTSLLKAASDSAAEAGFTCLRARASELERDFAYGCVRQLLEPVVATASDVARNRLFDGAAVRSLPLFSPGDASVDSSSPDRAFSMLHGLYWLLNNLSDDSPVMLAIDDLHWSDTESLRFLSYLARRLDGLPLAVLASTRAGEGQIAELARLAAGPETVVLRPGPLSIEATATLCEQRLGPGVAPEFASACRDATDGNPFYLEALLREAREQGLSTDAREAAGVRGIAPVAVAQAVLLRLSGRPAPLTTLVRAVAVLGDGASVAEAAELAGIAEAEAARAADLLAALAILRSGEGLEFAHPIVREAVYADVGSHERARAHGRAAILLAARGVSEERIAAQITATEPIGDPDRVELLRRVAGEALVKGAPAAAAAWLTRALAEPPSAHTEVDVLLELGRAELRLGAPGAVDHLHAAVAGLGEPRRLATAARELANALTVSGRADAAVEALETAIDVIEPEDAELALLLEAEVRTHALQGSREGRDAAAKRLQRHAALRGATPGERLVLASLACERARASESASEAAGHLVAGLAGGRLLREQQRDIVGTFYDLVLGLLATDALDVAEASLEQALTDARARASIPSMAWLTSRSGWVAFRRGDVAKAEDDARTALELLETHGIALGKPFALGLLVVALIERGQADAAQEALDENGHRNEIQPGMTTNVLLAARGLLGLARGRARDARDDLLEYGRRDELWGAASPLASRWRSDAALAMAAIGDREQARRIAAEDLERARQWGTASGIGVALRAVALVEGGEASIARLREATEVLERSPARLEHARALTDYGAALRRANRRTEARGVLGQGMTLAERCGANALAERARTELQAAGGRWSDPGHGGLGQLTASERRVAGLAAQGRSNPEIAQALFVTRKTVETHLGHVYEKLDIAGRGELPRVLAEQSRQNGT